VEEAVAGEFEVGALVEEEVAQVEAAVDEVVAREVGEGAQKLAGPLVQERGLGEREVVEVGVVEEVVEGEGVVLGNEVEALRAGRAALDVDVAGEVGVVEARVAEGLEAAEDADRVGREGETVAAALVVGVGAGGEGGEAEVLTGAGAQLVEEEGAQVLGGLVRRRRRWVGLKESRGLGTGSLLRQLLGQRSVIARVFLQSRLTNI
jgi:hypothetical protein